MKGIHHPVQFHLQLFAVGHENVEEYRPCMSSVRGFHQSSPFHSPGFDGSGIFVLNVGHELVNRTVIMGFGLGSGHTMKTSKLGWEEVAKHDRFDDECCIRSVLKNCDTRWQPSRLRYGVGSKAILQTVRFSNTQGPLNEIMYVLLASKAVLCVQAVEREEDRLQGIRG